MPWAVLLDCCVLQASSMTTTAHGLAVAGIMIFWPVLYFVLYVTYLLKAYNFVRSAPWETYRLTNLMVRVRQSACMHIALHC